MKINKIKALGIIKTFKKKINKNKELMKEIHNFERNIEPLLCNKCKVKLNRVKGGNIISIAAKGRYFCKECNDIIAKKSTEIFVRI